MNNVYGTNKPAIISSSDIDIYYYYKPNRSTDSSDFGGFKKLDSSLLTSSVLVNDDGDSETLPGMYNLRLPINVFKEKGIYTLYIKPKEIKVKILDVSTLAAYPNIKGIIFDCSANDDIIKTNGSMVGYRVEYFDNDERSELFRIITSNNKCEPISQNLNDSMQKGVRYRFNDSSNLMFCTLTPSVGSTFKSNSDPYIGRAGQDISLINTKFNPFAIEIEMVDHDADTISYMLEGEQIRNLENGLITTFNDKGEIYHQAVTGVKINPNTDETHDFKIVNSTIDFNEDINIVK